MTHADSSTSSQPEPLSQANVPGQGPDIFGADNSSGITANDEQLASMVSPNEETQSSLFGKTCETMNAAPFFPLTDRVTFHPVTAAPQQGAWPLSPAVARLVSLVSLGAVLLWPLSGCGSLEGGNLPCAVPTPDTTGTSVSNGTPVVCTTSSGTHYLWIPNRGGWVPSDDGVHPNPGESGVGADEGHGGDEGHSGVGEGHGGGHGGGEGG